VVKTVIVYLQFPGSESFVTLWRITISRIMVASMLTYFLRLSIISLRHGEALILVREHETISNKLDYTGNSDNGFPDLGFKNPV